MTLETEGRFPIGRNCFDADTLSAMAEIEALVLAYQSLNDMNKTFWNSPELNHENARPDAVAVFQVIKQTAAALQMALFKPESKRTQKIAAVREQFLPRLEKVAPRAQTLAEQESAATGGDVIKVRVLGTIRKIVLSWSSS